MEFSLYKVRQSSVIYNSIKLKFVIFRDYDNYVILTNYRVWLIYIQIRLSRQCKRIIGLYILNTFPKN